MKTRIINLFFSVILATGLSSCIDFLDIKPHDSYTEDAIFSDPGLTENYIKTFYTFPRSGWGTSALRFACDESMNNFNWNGVWTVNKGAMTPDDLGGIDIWAQYFGNIRKCNVFFDNMDKLQGDKRELLIAEMRFLRAFFYMDLVNRYGGVPIITRTFTLDDPEMMVKRNSYEECVGFIVSELDSAVKYLPLQWGNAEFGRATKGAALAMKSRMLLYAASPLWNPTGDQAKWQAASDAAWAVIDLKSDGAPLYGLDPDYQGMFLNHRSMEIIFERLFTSEFGHYFLGNNAPNGWGGYTATCVLQDMVDSYEMEDGTMPTPALYETADPYANRDPRFYASVLCDGQLYRGGNAEFYLNEDEASGGSDSEYGPAGWNATKTRYAIRKFIDDQATNYVWDICKEPWIYCRLGEIYLNYAEAQYHLGKEDVAREYVNYIRERARGGRTGIVPDVTESGDALLARIQRERKVELAFEEHRFFDVRRWKIAEVTENVPAHGVKIIRHADGHKTYEIVKVQDRKFEQQHYLLPIPQSERRKNNLLEQNPFYSK